ncbi:MAG: DUF6445 family protein [Candidatus Caenarcaniphilales bacterium]|nr:DUF6445 family protein [Candidatus Caenarcaniphilales bacterium]
MYRSLIVVDDFYNNPRTVREYALSQNYSKPDYITGYPGIETEGGLPPEQLTKVMKYFSSLIGKKVVSFKDDPQGRFRLQSEEVMKTRRNIIHADPCRWTGLVYLSLPEDCKGCLSIYKHNETGLLRIDPLNREVEEAMKRKQLDHEGLKGWLVEEGLDVNKWQRLSSVEYKFNRLILFDGGIFHGVQQLFGQTKEDSRLSQHFFFEEAE